MEKVDYLVGCIRWDQVAAEYAKRNWFWWDDNWNKYFPTAEQLKQTARRMATQVYKETTEYLCCARMEVEVDGPTMWLNIGCMPSDKHAAPLIAEASVRL